MKRARLHGWVLLLGAGLTAPAWSAPDPTQQSKDAPVRADRQNGKAASPDGAAQKGAATKPPADTKGSADGSAVESGAPASSAVAPQTDANPAPPDPTQGDRSALINEDVLKHPPQTQLLSRDPAHLQARKMKLGGLLDRSVHSLENTEVGRVIDVMTGEDGKPAALELDVGGFLGVGNRRIAVAWSLFDLSRTGQSDPLRVALSAAQVRSAPAVDESGDISVVTGALPIAPAAPPAEGAAPPAASVAPAVPPPAPASDPAGTQDHKADRQEPAATPAPPHELTAGPAHATAKQDDRKPVPHQTDTSPSPSRPAPAHRDGKASASPQSGNGDERF